MLAFNMLHHTTSVSSIVSQCECGQLNIIIHLKKKKVTMFQCFSFNYNKNEHSEKTSQSSTCSVE